MAMTFDDVETPARKGAMTFDDIAPPKEVYDDPIPSLSWGDLAAGAVRGAGSIGATILAPIDAAARAMGVENSWVGLDRRKAMDEGLQAMGADTESGAFKTGKFGAEVAGTLGAGGAIANTLRSLVPQATRLAPAIEAWGMTAPRAAGSSRLADAGYRVAGGAIPGAAAAGMVDPEHAAMGAGVGAAVPFAVPLAGKVINYVATGAQRLYGGAQGQAIEYLRKAFPDNWQEVAQRLKDLKGFLPGESPTSGIAAVSGERAIPNLKAIQEQANSKYSQQAADAATRNEAARAAPLEEIAHPSRRYAGEAASEAEALRAQVTDPLYARANSDRIPLSRMVGEEVSPLSDDLSAIIRGAEIAPSVSAGNRSFSQAQSNAQSAGRGVPEGRMAGVPTDKTPVTSGYRSEWELPPIGETSTFMPNYGSRSINELQRIKNYITKQIKDLSSATDEAGKLKSAQLTEARNELNSAMRQSGNYGVASDIFRNYSAAQNQGQVADVLLNALRSPGGIERGQAFLRAMKEAPGTIKKAGGPRFDSLNKVFTPDQMRNVVQPTERSVAREVDYSALEAPASSLPEVGGVLSKIEHGTPGMLQSAVTILRGIAKRIGANTDDASMELIHRATFDPKAFAKLIEMTPPAQRSAVMNGIRKYATTNEAKAFVGATPVAAATQ